jgi:predicted alpha/beta hydrolase family esterase
MQEEIVMPKQVLFIQGAGEGAHEADAKLAEGLHRALGLDYEIIYPVMPNEADAHYGNWKLHIEKELVAMQEPVILVAHSVGGSMLLKCLSEIKLKKPVAGIFVMAAPFWGGDGWRYEGYKDLELPEDLAARSLQGTPVFLYHCRDDDIVPYDHFTLYKKLLPHAAGRLLDTGGHQFDSGLDPVVQDIKS